MPTITQVAAPAFGTAITLAVLSAESRRLPLQNVVALTLVSIASAAIIEGIANTGRSIDLPRAMAAVPLTTASLLASRAIARLPGPGPHHLYLRTWLAAIVLDGLAHGPGGESPLRAATIRIAGIPAALLLLAPWWINKRLAPAHAPGWAGLAAPAMLLGLSPLNLLAGSPAMACLQIVAGSGLAFWAIRGLRRQPQPPT